MLDFRIVGLAISGKHVALCLVRVAAGSNWLASGKSAVILAVLTSLKGFDAL